MRRLACSVGILLLLSWIPFGVAQDPPSVPTPKEKLHNPDEPASEALIAEEVRQRLLQPVTFKCEGASLAEVIANRIAAPSKLDFYFDPQVEASGISYGEIVVTGDFRNTSIRSVLHRILAPAKLAYYCDDTGVCITTEQVHNERVFARVYDVSELIPQTRVGNRPDEMPHVPQTSGQSADLGPRPSPVKLVQAEGPNQPPADTAPSSVEWKDWDQKLTPVAFVAAIKQATGGNASEPWTSEGGKGTISVLDTGVAKLMVVRQTETIHAEIEDLLSEIFTHHHMQNKERPRGPFVPKTAKAVQPKIRTVKQ